MSHIALYCFVNNVQYTSGCKVYLNKFASHNYFKRNTSVIDCFGVLLQEKLPDPQMSRIFKMNAPEWPWILCGCIGAIITGAMQPAFAFIFAEVITVREN